MAARGRVTTKSPTVSVPLQERSASPPECLSQCGASSPSRPGGLCEHLVLLPFPQNMSRTARCAPAGRCRRGRWCKQGTCCSQALLQQPAVPPGAPSAPLRQAGTPLLALQRGNHLHIYQNRKEWLGTFQPCPLSAFPPLISPGPNLFFPCSRILVSDPWFSKEGPKPGGEAAGLCC